MICTGFSACPDQAGYNAELMAVPDVPTPAEGSLLEPAESPPILDYGRRRPKHRNDRVPLLISAAFTGFIGLLIFVGLVDLLFLTWPNFSVALAAVPIGLIAAAFLLVSLTAARVAVADADQPARGSTVSNSPTE